MATTLCPPGQTLSTPWVQQGLTPCFNDIVTTSLVFGLAAILGLCQAIFYSKYSTINPSYSNLRVTKLYALHLTIHVILTLLPIAQTIVSVYKIQHRVFYYYQIISTCFKGLLLIFYGNSVVYLLSG